MTDRIYTEDEVRAIIKRAVELQEQAPAAEHGLTIEELERLGADVGLDASYLRAAALEVANVGQTLSRRTETTATHVVVERWLDGPLSPEGWADAVALLRQRFGIDMGMWMGRGGEGRVETVGNAQEWAHASQLGVETRVSVAERGDRIRLRLTQRVGHASPSVEGKAYGAMAGLVLGVLVAVFAGEVLGSAWEFLGLIAVVSILATFVAAPVIERLDRAWRQKKLTQLDALADDLAGVLSDPAGIPAPTAAPIAARSAEAASVAAPRLALDEDEPEAVEGATSPRRVRS